MRENSYHTRCVSIETVSPVGLILMNLFFHLSCPVHKNIFMRKWVYIIFSSNRSYKSRKCCIEWKIFNIIYVGKKIENWKFLLNIFLWQFFFDLATFVIFIINYFINKKKYSIPIIEKSDTQPRSAKLHSKSEYISFRWLLFNHFSFSTILSISSPHKWALTDVYILPG